MSRDPSGSPRSSRHPARYNELTTRLRAFNPRGLDEPQQQEGGLVAALVRKNRQAGGDHDDGLGDTPRGDVDNDTVADRSEFGRIRRYEPITNRGQHIALFTTAVQQNAWPTRPRLRVLQRTTLGVPEGGTPVLRDRPFSIRSRVEARQ